MVIQFCPEINSLGCPCSGPTPDSLWYLDLTQMVLVVRKKFKSTHLNISNNFCFNNFAQKSIPGVILAEVLQEPVGASLWRLDLTQVVLAVRKKLKSTLLNIPNNFCFNNFVQKSIPAVFLADAEVLQETAPPMVVRAGNPGCHPCFGTLGVKRNPTVPHTWL